MKRFLSFIFFFCTFVSAQALADTTEPHMPSKLAFLEGSWTSTDPNAHEFENWVFVDKDTVLGMRLEKDSKQLFLVGRGVRMRGFDPELFDLRPSRLQGSVSSTAKNKAQIYVGSLDRSVERWLNYESPSPDLLDLEITVKGRDTKFVHHYKRVTSSPTEAFR